MRADRSGLTHYRAIPLSVTPGRHKMYPPLIVRPERSVYIGGTKKQKLPAFSRCGDLSDGPAGDSPEVFTLILG